MVGLQALWAALALGVFTLTASLPFHNFRAVATDKGFMQQLLSTKNLSVAGMFIVATLGAGPLSLDARRTSA
ncbi:MAG TPA: hypothetical protein PLG77_04005 [Burkholderiaceae bacterium]|nr:hypothetical protein [Burkholderiaceae bacterium]